MFAFNMSHVNHAQDNEVANVVQLLVDEVVSTSGNDPTTDGISNAPIGHHIEAENHKNSS